MVSGKRIVGGREAGEDEFPFVANIQYTHDRRPIQCVGTIVHNQVVIVPAFCVVHPDTHQPVDHRDLVVGYGSAERSKQRHARVVKIAVNHEFVPKEMTSDIALLQVESLDLTTSSVQRIPVYTGSIHAGQRLEVVGWGNDKPTGGEWTERLRTTSVVISDSDQCRRSRNYNGVEGRVLCTENKLNPGHDLCDGEFGASLIAKVDGQFQLFGTYSYHIDLSPEGYNQCAKDSSLAFYTHIYSYIGYISATAGVSVDSFTARTNDRPDHISNSKAVNVWLIALRVVLALIPTIGIVVWAMMRFRHRQQAQNRQWQGNTYELAPRSAATSDSDTDGLHGPRAEVSDITL